MTQSANMKWYQRLQTTHASFVHRVLCRQWDTVKWQDFTNSLYYKYGLWLYGQVGLTKSRDGIIISKIDSSSWGYPTKRKWISLTKPDHQISAHFVWYLSPMNSEQLQFVSLFTLQILYIFLSNIPSQAKLSNLLLLLSSWKKNELLFCTP
jgi:hypothetical protein